MVPKFVDDSTALNMVATPLEACASLGRCIVMRNMASTCLHSDVLLLTHFENVTRTLSGVEDSTSLA